MAQHLHTHQTLSSLPTGTWWQDAKELIKSRSHVQSQLWPRDPLPPLVFDLPRVSRVELLTITPTVHGPSLHGV